METPKEGFIKGRGHKGKCFSFVLKSGSVIFGKESIPAKYRDKFSHAEIPSDVTEISDGAFKDCKKLSELKLPHRLFVIGADAFSGCTSLCSLNMPPSVKTIGPRAFDGCTSLTKIIVGRTDGDRVREMIKASGFDGIDKLEFPNKQEDMMQRKKRKMAEKKKEEKDRKSSDFVDKVWEWGGIILEVIFGLYKCKREADARRDEIEDIVDKRMRRMWEQVDDEIRRRT